ncbi:hypothetical protein O1Q96_09610 [Streptomyces sp. Qhu-G9]|uniref:hypothetical protein n=1 Tax=Streptomyces sp. Qhu-G9 TaxID=3452799 RepID=UPI0022AC8530|nr:hypothetical protein [Streptomyces aurantiacus]WAU79974.1 hypothetical protein O1Q96_09610 [Streptomyces aurantiacus]
MEDLRLDRWLAAKQLLRDTGDDWTLRTSRSQVLAYVAADSNAIDAWCIEEPNDWDALMMRARVLTQRVLNAHRDGVPRRDLMNAVYAARTACSLAANRWPADPVPNVCYLALVQTDTDCGAPHNPLHWAARDDMLPPGPWKLLDWARERDPYNREAFHRMLNVLHARGEDGLYFAQGAAASAPAGSALKVLPLYSFVESYRRQRENGQTLSATGFWAIGGQARHARRALHDWFEQTTPAAGQPDTRSLLDLNYLAYGLTATGVGDAAGVFEAIGPYVTTAPWVLVTPNPAWWQDDFLSARGRALSVGGRR